MNEHIILRPGKPDDQEKAQQLYEILDKSIEPLDINPNQIVAALLSLIATNYKDNGFTFVQWRKEMQDAIKFYKRYWEKDE